MSAAARCLCAGVALLLCGAAAAGTVAAQTPVVVYDGPSENSTPRYLIGKEYPLVVISETVDWLTVCLHDGTSGNVLRQDTVPGDNVVATRPDTIRQDPAASGAPVLQVQAGLLLANTGEVINGWLPVRHASGISGFIPAASVWGHAGC